MVLVPEVDLLGDFERTLSAMIQYFFDNLYIFIFVLIILFFTYLVSRLVDKSFKRYLKNVQSRMKMDITKLAMLRHVSVGFVYLLGVILIVYTVPGLRALSSAILVSVGVIGLVFGMAAQDTFGNIVSGIALSFFRPFSVGDLITVQGSYGRVTDIDLRQTTILTSDNRTILIPNSVLNKETVINWTFHDKSVRWSFSIIISHDSDFDLARNIIVEEVRKNPNIIPNDVLLSVYNITSENARARISNLTPMGVEILIDFWVYERENAYPAEYAIRESIKRRFDKEEKVRIPLPKYALSIDSEEEKIKK